uniref:Uncharacterized protein n=1 Tax=Daphnia magna TaxID=35525 RepID=A0A0P6HJX8_9CRUS
MVNATCLYKRIDFCLKNDTSSALGLRKPYYFFFIVVAWYLNIFLFSSILHQFIFTIVRSL